MASMYWWTGLSAFPGSKIVDDLGPILFAHAAQAWANIGHALGNALGDDNIGPGSDRVRKQYWAKFGATRDPFGVGMYTDRIGSDRIGLWSDRIKTIGYPRIRRSDPKFRIVD